MKQLMILVSIFSVLNAQNTVTVFGIGRLGLCTALCFEKAGYDVFGVDINAKYVSEINNKTFNSLEPQVNEFLRNSVNFKATCSIDEGLDFSDLYYIMVDTPSTVHEEAYDHSKLSKVLSEINARKVQNKHVVIGCTIFPGYIRTVGQFLLRDCINTSLSY